MQTEWHIERVKDFSQDLRFTLLVSKMLLNVTTIINCIAANCSSISFVYYIVGERCEAIRRLSSSFSGLQYEWIGSRVWIWVSFCDFIENSHTVHTLTNNIACSGFHLLHHKHKRCPINYWRHFCEVNCRNPWWEIVVSNFTYSLIIAAEGTYNNQSVHDVLTGLQAGSTRHLQE